MTHTIRRLLIALMRRHGYQYSEAINGLEAVELYQETTLPRFDVVLMGSSPPPSIISPRLHRSSSSSFSLRTTNYNSSQQSFNLIPTDLSMPIMDGMTASSRIRKYEREQRLTPTRIVALTGLVSASAKLEALESGVNYYVTKPVNFAKLIELLPPE